MSILKVIEYNEGVAILEDDNGRFVVTKDDDGLYPLDIEFNDTVNAANAMSFDWIREKTER